LHVAGIVVALDHRTAWVNPFEDDDLAAILGQAVRDALDPRKSFK